MKSLMLNLLRTRVLLGLVLAISLSVIVEAQIPAPVLQTNQTISGTSCTAYRYVLGLSSIVIETDITGTFTFNLEGSVKSSTSLYSPIALNDESDTTPTPAFDVTVDGKYRATIAGYTYIRVCGTAGAGSAVISLGTALSGGSSGPGAAGGGGGGEVSISQTGNENAVDILTIAAGDTNIGNVDVLSFPDNEPINVAQINGVTPLMGAGNTGTGSPRTTEATDSQLSAGVGPTNAAAATAGSDGSINAKLKLLTTQLDAVKTAVETIDNAISGAGVNISQIGGAAPATTKCDDSSKRLSATISTASAGNVEVVALSASQVIYICDYDIDVVDDVVVQLIYGTGTACATGETDLFTHRFLTTGTADSVGIAKSGGGFHLTKTAASNAFCVELSAAVQIDINITYVKE